MRHGNGSTNLFPEHTDRNVLEVQHHGNVSRLTTAKGFPPLRIVNPRVAGPACHVLLSHYGGGMVDGDEVDLEVMCRKNSRLHLGSIGHLQVYRGRGKGTQQRVHGMLEQGALCVIAPDAVVLHADSSLRQEQRWHVHPGASLAIVELMIGGRLNIGECFGFREYRSELTVFIGETPSLRDVFVFRPFEHDYRDPALFAGRSHFLSMYLIGEKWHPLADRLAHESLRLRGVPGITLMSSVHALPHPGHVLRAVSHTMTDILTFIDVMYEFLQTREFLGFNPQERRY